jgi:phage/plasmid-associated DNA primase
MYPSQTQLRSGEAATWGPRPAPPAKMRLLEWTAVNKGALIGKARIWLPPRLEISDVAVFSKGLGPMLKLRSGSSRSSRRSTARSCSPKAAFGGSTGRIGWRLNDDHLARFIHRVDGATYLSGDDKPQIVRLNKSRVVSIIDATQKYRHQAGFFASPPRGINCESGFIVIDDDGNAELQPHARRWRHRHVTRGRWPTKDKDAFGDSLLAKYLRDATASDDAAEDDDGRSPRDKINLIGEIAGVVALGYGTRLRQPKAIVAYSAEGNTGKSTFLQLLRSFPNPEAVASVPPGKFGDEKYAHRLIGKTLNAADELPDRAVRSDVFKRMITGEPVPARDVYKSATDFMPIAQHVFSTNVLPSFAGGVDGGVLRRLLPLGFEHRLDEKECDPGLVSKILRDESDVLLDFAVEGARRLVKRGNFTVPASSGELLQSWVRDADPVRGWAADHLVITPYENVISFGALYAGFLRWAQEQGLKRDFLPNVKAFGKRLRCRPETQVHRLARGTVS